MPGDNEVLSIRHLRKALNDGTKSAALLSFHRASASLDDEARPLRGLRTSPAWQNSKMQTTFAFWNFAKRKPVSCKQKEPLITPMTTRQKWTYRISITLNLIFGIGLLLNYINSPSYDLGVLKEDVKLGLFNKTDTTLFALPKGLTVRNISQRGMSAIGQFENNRFEIVVTTERDDLVDYNRPERELLPFGNFYSADQEQSTE